MNYFGIEMVLCAPRVFEDARERELPFEDTQDLAHRRRTPPVVWLLPRATRNSDFYPENMFTEIDN